MESKKIKIGSKVSYKGAWGTQPEKVVTIEGIEHCKHEGDKYGTSVKEIPWVMKDYGVYDLSDGHWCYGYQIVSLLSDDDDSDDYNDDFGEYINEIETEVS